MPHTATAERSKAKPNFKLTKKLGESVRKARDSAPSDALSADERAQVDSLIAHCFE